MEARRATRLRLGVIAAPVGVEMILGRRHAPRRGELTGWLARRNGGWIPTRYLTRCWAHRLRYAVQRGAGCPSALTLLRSATLRVAGCNLRTTTRVDGGGGGYDP